MFKLVWIPLFLRQTEVRNTKICSVTTSDHVVTSPKQCQSRVLSDVSIVAYFKINLSTGCIIPSDATLGLLFEGVLNVMPNSYRLLFKAISAVSVCMEKVPS